MAPGGSLTLPPFWEVMAQSSGRKYTSKDIKKQKWHIDAAKKQKWHEEPWATQNKHRNADLRQQQQETVH